MAVASSNLKPHVDTRQALGESKGRGAASFALARTRDRVSINTLKPESIPPSAHSRSSSLPPPMASIASSEAAVTVDVHAGHKYLDVRTPEEFKRGHLQNAINVPYVFFTPQGKKKKNPDFLEQVSLTCNKDDHILVGFKNVKNMGGGFAAWVENGLPVKSLQEELY
ncbi:thiosulfate sulfurtransferase 18-like isoform X2 [Musa acuminata AAA Group]|uniref:thiosulfate sulfurtransferase 18-like isoform X2 n=1 Tax=Musa acuminata AAA Group TaxID=214697 RepID=UPI0031D0A13B